MRTQSKRQSRALWLAVGIVACIGILPATGGMRDALFAPVILVATAILLGRARRSGRHRWKWAALAVGLAVYAMGNLASIEPGYTGAGMPRPLAAQMLYLGGQATIVAALVWLAAPRERGWYRPALLDGVILASSLGLAFLWLAYDPVIARRAEAGGSLVAWAYPALDLALVALIGGRLYARRARPAAVILLLAGAMGWLGADVGYALSTAGPGGPRPTDAGWLLGWVCFAAAALHPSSTRLGTFTDEDDDLSNGRLVFVAACLAAGIAVLLFHDPQDPAGRAAEIVLAILFAVSGGARLLGALVRARELLQAGQLLREELDVRARSDPLTALPNRLVMSRRLDLAIAGGAGAALLCMDLDDFKVVNDAWGHHTGDALLRGVAERIRGVTRHADDVARLGGDEFTVIVSPCADLSVAERVAERIRGAFDEPIVVDGHSIRVRPSIGIGWAAGRDATGTSLLQQADLAMYDAKARGGNQWRPYERSMRDHAVERASLRADLEDALARDEIGLVYQPIIRIADGEVVAVEALARWRHPVQGHVSPATFVRIAEAAGITDRLTRNVLVRACRQAAAWDAQGAAPITMHVNLSPLDVTDRGLVEIVGRALADAGLAPSRLTLELTETSLVDAERVGPVLRALKQLGTRLALDDFGSRYAVIANLAELPFDIVKIDRTITGQLGTDRGRRLVSGVVRLAESLGVDSLAEGVEDAAMLHDLRAIGCSLAQGYALGLPLEASELLGHLPARHATAQRPSTALEPAPSA